MAAASRRIRLQGRPSSAALAAVVSRHPVPSELLALPTLWKGVPVPATRLQLTFRAVFAFLVLLILLWRGFVIGDGAGAWHEVLLRGGG